MKRFLVITALLSSLAAPSYAGMNEGVAAATAGDYPRAFAEFEPLAAAGEPAAQYYLAKLYLEGRGPADGVIRGVDLMTKAANGGHPEAQAQLGLMYAMGLGVDVDNVKAHEWLNKAIAALPDGMRRTVAEANRDAVLQRMTTAQRSALASRTMPATTPVTATKPTQETAPKADTAETAATPPAPAKPTVSDTKAADADPKKPTTTQVAAAKTETKQPEMPVVKTGAKPADTMTKAAAATATPAEAKPADMTKTAAALTKTTTDKPAETKPAATQTAAAQKPAETKPAATQTAAAQKPAETKTPAAKPTTTQTASAAPATEAQVKAAVRIQVGSLPSEDGAWAGWKELSAKYADQFTGLTPVVESADLGDLGMRYRIQVGPFQTVADANTRCDAMKKAGLDCLVVGKQQ